VQLVGEEQRSSGFADSARVTGRARFEQGDFAGAREAFERAIAAGDSDPETVDTLLTLYADATDNLATIRLIATTLDDVTADHPAAVRLPWAVARFDAVARLQDDAAQLTDAAIRLLETAAEAGNWTAITDPTRRPRLLAAFSNPLQILERLEQESYAPVETGLPAAAAGEAEDLGHRFARDPSIARAAERLLHGLGHPEAAYRVEALRLAAATAPARTVRAPSHALPAWTVVLAGGHPALRRLAGVDLRRHGAIGHRDIPSSWEATRSTRAIREQLNGCDVVVMIWRQLDHSTADRIRVAAAQTGVPIVHARTAGVSSVVQATLEFAASGHAG